MVQNRTSIVIGDRQPHGWETVGLSLGFLSTLTSLCELQQRHSPDTLIPSGHWLAAVCRCESVHVECVNALIQLSLYGPPPPPLVCLSGMRMTVVSGMQVVLGAALMMVLLREADAKLSVLPPQIIPLNRIYKQNICKDTIESSARS